MGVYLVNCPTCGAANMWFSGSMDQRCAKCRDISAVIDGTESVKNSELKEIKVYIDGVDWQHEIGNASDGSKIYSSLQDILKYNACSKNCGVVRCKLVFEEWIVPQDLNKILR